MYAGTNKLIAALKIAKAKGTILNDLKRIERADLLILDDFGMQSLDPQARGIMMDIIEDRHGKRSTMIASQLAVKQWHDAIGEQNVADAILDRIVHHALRGEPTTSREPSSLLEWPRREGGRRSQLSGESIRKRKIKNESLFL